MSNELHHLATILDSLASRGVHVEAIGDRIQITPRGIAGSADLDALRANRAEVLAELRRRASPVAAIGTTNGQAASGGAGKLSSAEVSPGAMAIGGEPTVNWFDAMCGGLADKLNAGGRVVTRPDGRRIWLHPNEREARK